jgi:hypothetical protein
MGEELGERMDVGFFVLTNSVLPSDNATLSIMAFYMNNSKKLNDMTVSITTVRIMALSITTFNINSRKH